MKEEHDYTVKTYYDTTDKEHILRESADFFANENCIYGDNYHFFEDRAKIEKGKDNYICGFCKNKLHIRGGQGEKKQTLHFRHFSGDNKGCIYEEKKRLSKEEVLRIKYNGAKESKKHEEYKNFIADRLLAMTTPRLKEEDVLVEKIYRNKSVPREWRRPDVLAKFPDKTIAFELQLSTTFLSVITGREAFYLKQKIFIIWIFDNFSTESEEQLFAQKDILVSNVYNVFVLDQEAIKRSIEENTIYLKCHYVDFKIIDGKIRGDKMISKLVSFSDLTFRETDYKVFYVDAIEQRNRLETELKNTIKVDEILQKIDDIYYYWNISTLHKVLSSIDISTIFPRLENILIKIEKHGSLISIKNGISFAQLLVQHPSMNDKEKLKSKIQEYYQKFELIAKEKHVNEIISQLEEECPRAIEKISMLSEEDKDILIGKAKTLVTKILEQNYPDKKNISMAHFMMQTGIISDENKKQLKKLLTVKYESDINYYIENKSLEGFISYYKKNDCLSQESLTEVLLNRYRELFFHPIVEFEESVYFYTSLLKSSSVWFDIRLVFGDNDNCLLNFTKTKHDEGDSSQWFFSDVIYCLFRLGYQLSAIERKTIKDKLVGSFITKNELLRNSLLQCYGQIQNANLSIEQKKEYYILLHDNWTFISRILSVLMKTIIGCNLVNMASIADNVKSHHLQYAHLFILAAESDRGKRNEYKGKKGSDNLSKLKDAMKPSPKYKKNEKLDKLLPILFPRVEAFNSLRAQ
jgi:hypothetical protein